VLGPSRPPRGTSFTAPSAPSTHTRTCPIHPLAVAAAPAGEGGPLVQLPLYLLGQDSSERWTFAIDVSGAKGPFVEFLAAACGLAGIGMQVRGPSGPLWQQLLARRAPCCVRLPSLPGQAPHRTAPLHRAHTCLPLRRGAAGQPGGWAEVARGAVR
jgi:hypothetical protein